MTPNGCSRSSSPPRALITRIPERPAEPVAVERRAVFPAPAPPSSVTRTPRPWRASSRAPSIAPSSRSRSSRVCPRARIDAAILMQSKGDGFPEHELPGEAALRHGDRIRNGSSLSLAWVEVSKGL